MCGRLVDSFFDHVDVDCMNWPTPDDEVANAETPYRDFIVSVAHVGYEWVHKDYDGPEDSRAGHGKNREECYRAIDEWHEENA